MLFAPPNWDMASRKSLRFVVGKALLLEIMFGVILIKKIKPHTKAKHLEGMLEDKNRHFILIFAISRVYTHKYNPREFSTGCCAMHTGFRLGSTPVLGWAASGTGRAGTGIHPILAKPAT